MKLIERISWPQVAVLGIFAASGVAAIVLTPPETIARIAALDWRAIVFATISAVAAVFGIWRGQGVVKPRVDPKTGAITWAAVHVDADGVMRSQRPPPLPPMSIAPPDAGAPEVDTEPDKPASIARARSSRWSPASRSCSHSSAGAVRSSSTRRSTVSPTPRTRLTE